MTLHFYQMPYRALNLLQLRDIHEKVLGVARQLVPVNKARLVSFFASGSGRTRCIARHLAYCLLAPAPITLSVCFPPSTSTTTTRTSLRSRRFHLNHLYYYLPLMLDPASFSTSQTNPRIMRSSDITLIYCLWLSLILRRTLKKSALP